MHDNGSLAAIGGIAGAAAALAIVFAAASLGWLPSANGAAFHDYLLAHPAVLVEMTNELQAQEDSQQNAARQAAVDKLGMKAFLDPRIAFVTGPAQAKTTVVEFFDYNCPYCRASLDAVKRFYARNKNARFAFIEFPIKGPLSTVAARAALAARKQPDKYVKFHFALMGEEGTVDDDTVYMDARKAGLDVTKLKSDMKLPQIDGALVAARALAQAAQIDGTPAFIVNGRIREGAMNYETLQQMATSRSSSSG